MDKKCICLVVFLLFIKILLAQEQSCDQPPGDQPPKMGCPDPSGTCPPEVPNVPPITIPVVLPKDPNEIIGPKGYDTAIKWVSIKDNLPYKILFENDLDFATAPAQKVIIYLPIHPKFNPSSLRIGDFGFGKLNFSVPPNTSVYTKRLDVRDSLGVLLDVTAGLDINKRRAFWVFESIDPATGLAATLPANSGFLPVNDSSKGNGEGYVTLNIQPASNAKTLDTVSATASIIFDINDAIVTNSWLNTIDAVAPNSKIDTMPSNVNPAIKIKWTAQDDSTGVGIQSYDLYMSQNAGPFALLQGAIDTTYYDFVGQPGSSYSFYTRAVDYTGNREESKTEGILSVTVKLPASTICPGENITFSVPDFGTGYTYQWQADTTGTGVFININNNAVYAGTTTRQIALNTPPTSNYGFNYRCRATKGTSTIFTPAQVLKFSTSWTGGANNVQWESPANWSCNKIPDGFTDVIIPSAIPVLPVINSNAACHSLILKPGTSLNVVSGFTLDIKGK